MRVIIEKDAADVSRRGAGFVADLVRRQPDGVLGLTTGPACQGLYEELVRLHRNTGLDFSRVTVFGLDEYAGLAPTHPESRCGFLQEHLLRPLNISPSRTHLLDGQALDFAATCRLYEQRIQDAGGIDLQLLGLGQDGRLAFNEPGSSLGSRTRIKTLSAESIRENALCFGGEEQVPRLAMTMGVGTILEARRCLLLATGTVRAGAVRSTLEGYVTAQVTASALQLHRDVVVVVDEAAGSWLTRRAYYAEVERSQALLESGQWQQLGLRNP